MLSNLLAKIWAFLWPPIDDSPIEPVTTPASPESERPAPTLFGEGGQPATQPPVRTRIPPHQRYRVMATDDRWRVYSSFKLPPEPAERRSAPRRRAS